MVTGGGQAPGQRDLSSRVGGRARTTFPTNGGPLHLVPKLREGREPLLVLNAQRIEADRKLGDPLSQRIQLGQALGDLDDHRLRLG